MFTDGVLIGTQRIQQLQRGGEIIIILISIVDETMENEQSKKKQQLRRPLIKIKGNIKGSGYVHCNGLVGATAFERTQGGPKNCRIACSRCPTQGVQIVLNGQDAHRVLFYTYTNSLLRSSKIGKGRII